MQQDFSFWELDFYTRTTYDVIIVGAGIVGLSAAIQMKKQQQNLHILVIEKQSFGTLASTRNAGFVCLGSPSELALELENGGENQLLKSISLKWRGIERLFKLVGKTKPQFKQHGGFEIFTPHHSTPEPDAKQVEALNKVFERVTRISNFFTETPKAIQETWGFENLTSAYSMHFEGGLHSAKMHQALELKALNLGVKMLRNTQVISIEEKNDNIKTIQVNHGFELKAKQLLLCTNAFTNQLTNTPITPGRGTILTSEPLPYLQWKGNFHLDGGYVYFRSFENRLIIGGGRNMDFDNEETTQTDVNPKIEKYLTDLVSTTILPGKTVSWAHKHSGIMGFTPNKFPIMQFAAPNTFIAAGLNGIGVAMGAEIGFNAATALLGSIGRKSKQS